MLCLAACARYGAVQAFADLIMLVRIDILGSASVSVVIDWAASTLSIYLVSTGRVRLLLTLLTASLRRRLLHAGERSQFAILASVLEHLIRWSSLITGSLWIKEAAGQGCDTTAACARLLCRFQMASCHLDPIARKAIALVTPLKFVSHSPSNFHPDQD